MRQRRGELAERGQPRHATDLRVRLSEGLLGLPPVGDVEAAADVAGELPRRIVTRRAESSTQRYSPSKRRRRYSSRNGTRASNAVTYDARHASRSSGCTPSAQPSPSSWASVRPVNASHQGLKKSQPLSTPDRQIITGASDTIARWASCSRAAASARRRRRRSRIHAATTPASTSAKCRSLRRCRSSRGISRDARPIARGEGVFDGVQKGLPHREASAG